MSRKLKDALKRAFQKGEERGRQDQRELDAAYFGISERNFADATLKTAQLIKQREVDYESKIEEIQVAHRKELANLRRTYETRISDMHVHYDELVRDIKIDADKRVEREVDKYDAAQVELQEMQAALIEEKQAWESERDCLLNVLHETASAFSGIENWQSFIARGMALAQENRDKFAALGAKVKEIDRRIEKTGPENRPARLNKGLMR